MQISLSATVIPNTLTLKYAFTLSVMKAAFFNSARLIATTSACFLTWKHALSARFLLIWTWRRRIPAN
jgi:hypothetical protein